MTARTRVVARKTFGDFLSPKLVVGYFVPYLLVTWLFARGGAGDPVGALPLAAQEQALASTFLGQAFLWTLGLPTMALVGVLAANGVALEAERGTLRILLSKPVGRSEVLVGKFLAIVGFAYVTAVVGLLALATSVYLASGATATALGGGVFAYLPALLAYALVVVFLLAGVGTTLAAVTGSRLLTALGTLLVPALFLGFILVRSLTGGAGAYLTFRLYLVDPNYHLGNAYVTFLELLGPALSPQIQAGFGTLTGVYDPSGWGPDPFVSGLSGSVPVVGHVPAPASVAVLVGLPVALVGLSLRHFARMDVS